MQSGATWCDQPPLRSSFGENLEIKKDFKIVAMRDVLPINPLITNKIGHLDISDKIKTILIEILEMEDRLEIQDEKKGAVPSISKIIEKHADDKGVMETCSGYGKHA